ncbi:glycoside hydrolase family 27 protein [Mycolicibacterium sp. CH28]|uniref:glycoside hydrolase family 27 protein n=1 Tax=Mycolicibacterium sp. CH28 TaxID=2512237 RepID=UPI00108146C3|nr:glycoside hydrolase family 27 protein [Mycolicibacterium sp. CH28]TGD84583.1 glycoside hydrolase family 27 protein [Mycolicibacterium sp. CH28]
MRILLSATGAAVITLLAGCSALLPNVAVPAPLSAALISPPMGWNSWNSGMELTERSVLETIDAMVSTGMRDAGYRYVNLDAGWAAPERDSAGVLVSDPVRFPRGLAPLARYAHAKGLLFGIYSSPFNQTCGQALPTASLGHEALDAATFATWSVDYLKYDWCRDDAEHTEQVRVFTAMGAALQATGRRIVYAINPNSSSDPVAGSRFDWSGVADVVRTSGDLTPLWRNVLPPIGPADPFAVGMFAGVPDQFARAAAHPGRTSYVRDPDMLVVGVTWTEFFINHREQLKQTAQTTPLSPAQRAMVEPMLSMPAATVHWMSTAQPSLTEDEQRTHFTLWAMLSAPLLAGNDVRSMSATTRSILTNRDVIAIDQDPLSAPPETVGDPRVWAKALADGSVAVAFFNPSETAAEISTSALGVGLSPSACYTSRDPWTHETHSTSGPLSSKTLGPHGVRLLRVTPDC